MQNQRKGLQDIKTSAGRVTSPGPTYKPYIRLSVLEMERVRRNQEAEIFQAKADAARSRVDRLDSEIAEIVRNIASPHATNRDHAQGSDTLHEPGLVAIKHAYGVTRSKKAAVPLAAEPHTAEPQTAEPNTAEPNTARRNTGANP
ncbi:MAG: hypothetical protein AAF108_06620 [Planctomycetota bacterium]